jgi:ATP-dependent helicase HrpB
MINYTSEKPFIEARIQDLFGVKIHPTIADDKIDLLLKLQSPANKEIQQASSITSLWETSWELLRADLRPRYPRHYWPDDPANSSPTRMKRHVLEKKQS